MIPLSIPHIGGNEWKYVKDCLDSSWVSSAGSYVNQFEQDLADYVGAPQAVACVNGTSALQLALLAAGVRAEDLVIVPTVTFIAPVNVIKYLGADPLFADCDEFYNIDAQQVLDFLESDTETREGETYDKETGRRISALIPVHVFGHAARLGRLVDACRLRGIVLIEDATESLGTRYVDGPLAGSHTGLVGDLGCFSFNGNKVITTGGGGMVVTRSAPMADRIRYLSTQAKDDPLRYVHDEVGFNMRLTNVQAAIGVAQLEQLPRFLARRREIRRLYGELLAGIPGLELADGPAYADNNNWLLAVRIQAEEYGENVESLMSRLAAAQIETRPLWQPNHLQKPFAGCRCLGARNSMTLWKETLNIPSSVGLSDADIGRVAGALRR
jgi:perosamine synthetase